MVPGGGKRKGSAFEREMCRVISLFWSNNSYKDLCWRSASSGVRGTTTSSHLRSKVKGYFGDLTATSPLIEPLFKVFSIECKFYAKIDVTEILRGIKNNKLLEFWTQAYRDARHSGRTPVLITKQNFLGILMIVRTADAEKFLHTMDKPIKYMTIAQELSIFSLDDFLKNVNKERFIRTVKILAEESINAEAESAA
jgi:hypothetical protein